MLTDFQGKRPPDLALQPLITPGQKGFPCFGVLPEAGPEVIQKTLRLLEHLDNSLPSKYLGDVSVTISLTTSTLFDKSFPKYLIERTQSTNIDPVRIKLEIKETSMRDVSIREQAIPELSGYGFGIVVSNFLADDGSFSVLSNPHVGAVKLHKSVVTALPRSMKARRFLKGVRTLAEALDKQVIIDGVETFTQALVLEQMGMGTFQGSYYGKPLDANQVEDFVVQQRQQVLPIAFKPFD